MKTLTLLRHAKSSRKEPWLSDHERPLNKRWNRDIPHIRAWAQSHDIYIDGILSSDATRTKLTAQWMMPLMTNPEIVYIPDLYMANLDTLIRTIRSADIYGKSKVSRDHLMIVAHNPWLTHLCQHLWYDTSNLPTCGLVQFECNIQMRYEFESRTATYIQHIYPKELSD